MTSTSAPSPPARKKAAVRLAKPPAGGVQGAAPAFAAPAKTTPSPAGKRVERTVAARPRSHRYSVYVVELAPEVWNVGRFRRGNPDYILGQPFVYVGMTGLDPDVRFDKHKAGIQSSRFVRDFGVRLLPELYAMYNPMPYEGARDMEVELGIGLREQGYGVWQG